MVPSDSDPDHLLLRTFANVEITYDSFVSCVPAYKAALAAFPFKPNYQKEDDHDVAFQMLSDDFMSTLRQVRMKQSM